MCPSISTNLIRLVSSLDHPYRNYIKLIYPVDGCLLVKDTALVIFVKCLPSLFKFNITLSSFLGHDFFSCPVCKTQITRSFEVLYRCRYVE